MSTQAGSSKKTEAPAPVKRGKGKGPGKQPKHFMQQKEALELAASIAGILEEKAHGKAEKHRQAQDGKPRPERKPKVSASRIKLKETKALISAEKARSKKEKFKIKKMKDTDTGLLVKKQTQTSRPSVKPRKSVSFA